MKDCAFNNGNKCIALNEKQCVGCPFRKTQEELDEGRQKALKRISKLPPKLQAHILTKYYARRSRAKC